MAAFASPSGKLHEDIKAITNSMNELGILSERIKGMNHGIITSSNPFGSDQQY